MRASHLEVDVRRPAVRAGSIRAGLQSAEAKSAFYVGTHRAKSGEAFVPRAGQGRARMAIAPLLVGLPNLDQRVCDDLAVKVRDATAERQLSASLPRPGTSSNPKAARSPVQVRHGIKRSENQARRAQRGEGFGWSGIHEGLALSGVDVQSVSFELINRKLSIPIG